MRSATASASAAVVDVLDEHGELVAAEPRGGVGAAQRVAQPLGDADEQLVAGGVAEGVVDRLEVVEVDEQHRHGLAGAAAAQQRVVDAVAEQRAVGEVGERVVEGLVRELLLQLGEARDRLLEVTVLQRRAGLDGERLEEVQVALVEAARA